MSDVFVVCKMFNCVSCAKGRCIQSQIFVSSDGKCWSFKTRAKSWSELKVILNKEFEH